MLGAESSFSIDPATFGNTTHYSVYDISRLVRMGDWKCHVIEQALPVEENPFEDRQTGGTLRIYDLAVAAVPSYTNFHGGTPALAQAAIVTMVNRLNQIYEREFACRFQLVANNQNLMYTTANPGPYTDGDLGAMLGENQTNINSVIGSGNYDIGHVVSAQNLGGLAQLNAVCGSGKARGGTGVNPPLGDFFTVKYVGHEIGHQFGASHSFNADDSAGNNTCLPNRSSNNAYEPGSGSTIMGYQGLCGSSNNLSNWDTMFNQGAYMQVVARITGGGNCGTNSNTANNLPTITPLTTFTIPIGTAFTATGIATDADGDALTYSWEQRNLGAAQPAIGTGSTDNGSSPLFRVFAPSTSNTRTFPRLVDVLDGTPNIGEQYPTVARTLSLRLTVRDNRAGFGAVRVADINYTVNASGGPFVINVFNTGGSVPGNGTTAVTWNVANTNASPFNATSVRILLSIDGGTTFPYVLSASTPNDGSENVTIPTVTTNQARIRVEPTNNVFFDINNANFAINCPSVQDVLATDSTSCNFVRVTWTAVPGATGYRIQRGPVGGSFAEIASVSGQFTTQFDDTTAVPGTQYNYAVRLNSAQCTLGGPQSAQNAGQRAATTAITSNPVPQSVSLGGTATFNVLANGTGLAYQWQRNSINLNADPRFSGLNGSTLQINSVQAGDAGNYRCVVTGLCGASATSGAAALSIATGPTCDLVDFNNDGAAFDPTDIEAFLSVFAEGPCLPLGAMCNDIDFNNDTSTFDPCDIESFLLVFSEGPCTICGQ